MRISKPLLAVAVTAAALFMSAVPAFAAPAPAASAAASASATSGSDDASNLPGYDKFAKGAETQSGLFTLLRKDGKVYIVLGKDQLDTDFYEHATTSNGLGGFGLLAGDDFQQFARIIRFERVNDKQVALVMQPNRFEAPAGSPAENAIQRSAAASTWAVTGVVAEDKGAGKIVIDTAFLLGDDIDLGNNLNDIVENPKNPMGGYHLDPTRSYYGVSKSFPENDLIDVSQTYASAKPDAIDNVTDPHSITFTIAYNFAKVLSSPDYVPRLADDRVGYWNVGRLNFGNDTQIDNQRRYVTRWNIKASDPTRPSNAVKPIVYTLTNEIPAEYRPAIRDAILEWNRAFEKIGILNAVKVQDQPNDPNWDPDDIRNNPIRWLTETNGGGFAEAQVEWDPRTGEIFRGGVLIDSDIMKFGKFYYTDIAAPAVASTTNDFDALLPKYEHRHGFTHRDTGIREQGAYGQLAATLMGDNVPASYSYDYMKAIVLHEVGHDFGLMHNFISPDAFSNKELRDKNFVATHGVASSVMAYAPANVWPKGWSSGALWQTVLGPYDYHVIHWGYAPIPSAHGTDAEVSTLNRWASAATDPRYAFASDEDVEWDGHAVDPRINQWILSSDQVAWSSTQLKLQHDLLMSLDKRFPRAEMPWDQERFAFSLLIGFYGRSSGELAHFIGGEHLSRSRRGDTHAPLPLTPIARNEEWAAFQALDKYLFSSSAWQLSSSTLRRMTYSEYEPLDGFGYDPAPRHDISLATTVALLQNRALAYMFAPLVLQRLDDMPSKAAQYHPMTLADDFVWTQNSVYGDLMRGKPEGSELHHNLQRNFARLLEHIAVAPTYGTPYDAQALAHHQLVALLDTVHANLKSYTLGLEERAHLEALAGEVQQTLDTRSVRNVAGM